MCVSDAVSYGCFFFFRQKTASEMRCSDWSSDVCSSDHPVHAGTLNIEAPIRVRVTAAGGDAAIADIARLMGEAAQGKSRYVRIADRAARYYAPAVHTLALLAFAGWMIAGAGWHHKTGRASCRERGGPYV